MNPNNSSQSGDALEPVGSSTPQPTSGQDQQTAAANVIRSQIDSLYSGRPALQRDYSRPAPQSSQPTQPSQTHSGQAQHSQPAQQQQPLAQHSQTQNPQAHQQEAADPYNRTHTAHPQPEAEQWKQYHSAWQNYYQKYYESYYEHKRKQEAAEASAVATAHSSPNSQNDAGATSGYFGSQGTAGQLSQPAQQTQSNQSTGSQPFADTLDNEELDKNQALFELRQKLLKKVSGRAEKIRRSKHFVPITAALGVVLIFVFLQYNRVFIATVSAYVSPGSMDVQNIVIDPTADTAVSPDPRLIIPKINVDVPAIYDTTPDHDAQMAAMAKGVAHFGIPGANSRPGEIGNTVLSGHSSNDLFDQGDYKFIFAQLEKLQKGDTIYANYEGKRYTYVVTKMEVVKPTQVDKLIYPTDKPVLTLITCTPLGTARDRLLVTAEQISPDPASAAAAPAGSGQESEGSEIPGNSPTILERIFGAR